MSINPSCLASSLWFCFSHSIRIFIQKCLMAFSIIGFYFWWIFKVISKIRKYFLKWDLGWKLNEFKKFCSIPFRNKPDKIRKPEKDFIELFIDTPKWSTQNQHSTKKNLARFKVVNRPSRRMATKILLSSFIKHSKEAHAVNW